MTKITELGVATTPLDPTDLIEVVQNVAGTPVNRKVPVSEIGSSGGGGGGGVVVTRPTHGANRTGSFSLGSLSTPWTGTITVGDDEAIDYQLDASYQSSQAWRHMVALAVGGTVIDRRVVEQAANNVEVRATMGGVWVPPAAGTYTFEVLATSDGSSTLTFSAVPNTALNGSTSSDGVSSLRLRRDPVL